MFRGFESSDTTLFIIQTVVFLFGSNQYFYHYTHQDISVEGTLLGIFASFTALHFYQYWVRKRNREIQTMNKNK